MPIQSRVLNLPGKERPKVGSVEPAPSPNAVEMAKAFAITRQERAVRLAEDSAAIQGMGAAVNAAINQAPGWRGSPQVDSVPLASSLPQYVLNHVMRTATLDECRVLRDAINRRLGAVPANTVMAASPRFRTGERVTWWSRRYGKNMQGRITRVNRVNLSVMTDEGQQWRVAPSFLSKV